MSSETAIKPFIYGSIPDLRELPPGAMLHLRTGTITQCREYASTVPPYPDYPDTQVWNPGQLARDGFIFGGWSTRPFGIPIYLVTHAMENITLYPVWRTPDGDWELNCDEPDPPPRERLDTTTHTVRFTLSRRDRMRFGGSLPDTLRVAYGSELDLVNYGSDAMTMPGRTFAGWSVSPLHSEIVPRVCVVGDLTLYAVFYTVRLPMDKPPTHGVTFVSGVDRLTIPFNHSSVLRVSGYVPPGIVLQSTGKNWQFAGWVESPLEEDRLSYNAKPSQLPFQVKVSKNTTLYTAWNLPLNCTGTINDPDDEPPILEPPPELLPCEVSFQLEARHGPRVTRRLPETREITFQVLREMLQTPLVDGVFHFDQQFPLEVPELYANRPWLKNKQTYGEDPHIPEYEKLELLVDNSVDGNPAHIWFVPTGGLTSSGAPAVFDWDIWIDYRYVGRYTGTGGLRTRGIELDLSRVMREMATGVRATPRYVRLNREDPVQVDVRVTADGVWNCVLFYVHMTSAGTVFSSGLGLYEEFLSVTGLSEVNYGNKTLRVGNSKTPIMDDRLLQGFVFWPAGRKIYECAVEMVLLDFVDPALYGTPLLLNRTWIDVEYGCAPPTFKAIVGQVERVIDSSLSEEARCVLDAVVRDVLVPRPVVPPEEQLSTVVSVGSRFFVKDVMFGCAPPALKVVTSQVPLRNRAIPLSDRAKEELRCQPYTPGDTAKIIIRPHWKAPRFHGWLRAFGFHRDSAELWNTKENKDKLLQVDMRITPLMFCDTSTNAGHYCMRYLFYGCRKLQLGSSFTFHNGWENVREVGNEFMAHAFRDCKSLDGFPVNYVEPQGLVIAGNDFKAHRCHGCSALSNLGTVLSPSPRLAVIGHGFEIFEYSDCEKLAVLPHDYTEPATLIGNRPFDFQMGKFRNCRTLRTLPDRFTESVLVETGDNYLAYKYQNSGLTFLPCRYSSPYALTYAGTNCQTAMFDGCARLRSLPETYTEIAPGIIGNNFIKYKFRECSQLAVPDGYLFPNLGTDVNKPGVFEKTFPHSTGDAERIVNGNAAPSTPRQTFGPGFTGLNNLHPNWQ